MDRARLLPRPTGKYATIALRFGAACVRLIRIEVTGYCGRLRGARRHLDGRRRIDGRRMIARRPHVEPHAPGGAIEGAQQRSPERDNECGVADRTERVPPERGRGVVREV